MQPESKKNKNNIMIKTIKMLKTHKEMKMLEEIVISFKILFYMRTTKSFSNVRNSRRRFSQDILERCMCYAMQLLIRKIVCKLFTYVG